MAVPALAAALIAALVLGPDPAPSLNAVDPSSPQFLSRQADLPAPQGVPALHPIVIRGGRPALGTDAAVNGVGAASRPAPPARVTIRAVGLAASVVPVAGTREGIGVPPPGRAGWYDAGPRPGEAGRSVLVGHVDDIAGRLATFGRIAEVKDGARIKVTDGAGRVHAFEVVGRAQVRKSAFPRGDVFGPSRRPVLVLITCGGPWLGRKLGYRDNILVYARSL
jgi:hypothetical protein